MKNPFSNRAPPFDANSINQTIQRALASAGLDTASGPMHKVTEIISRALGRARPAPASERFDSGSVVDVAAVDVDTRHIPAEDDGAAIPNLEPWIGKPPQPPGSFETHDFTNAAGTRSYKVYVPAALTDAPHAMMVMLHGCTQTADDFAAGTQMNRLADEHGFVVVYPEQAAQANPSRCWNWFKPQDQLRGAGEPSLIADIVLEAAQRHAVDPRQIYVAGLSAGAAMAVVMGETYPELFAGVGAHSGLPYGSAHDIPSALAAMKGGRSGIPGLKSTPGTASNPLKKAVQALPVIVFHGDRDHTVRQTNGRQIVQHAQEAREGQAEGSALHESTQEGVAPGGRRYSRTVHVDDAGQAWIEIWTLHGAGHAWSGGHASGTFTDGTGPDASAEMVRFFMALTRAGSA